MMTQTIWSQGEYTISTDNRFLDVDTIHHYLSKESYWATGIPREILQKSINNSFCFGIYHGNMAVGESPGGRAVVGQQVGFARVVTDYATFGWLADVFVLPEHRGRGLSKWLVQTIVEHPEMQQLRRLMLATHDAHGLYSQYGFEPLEYPDRFLGIARGTSVYQK